MFLIRTWEESRAVGRRKKRGSKRKTMGREKRVEDEMGGGERRNMVVEIGGGEDGRWEVVKMR